jgi:hypothetical protein
MSCVSDAGCRESEENVSAVDDFAERPRVGLLRKHGSFHWSINVLRPL